MSHIYQTQITTEENLQTVLTAIENFNFDRLLAALKDRRSLSVSDILAMDARITEATSKLQTEYARLQEEAPAFNKRFVHRNNHYFSSAEALLRKIRSGVARFKDLYSRLTPNRTSAYQGLPMPEDKPSIYDRSLLGNAAYTPSLFPETVRPEVKQLYEHIVAFLAQMEDALNLCKDVLDDEALIREDAGQCRELYMDFKDEPIDLYRRLRINVDMCEELNVSIYSFPMKYHPIRDEHSHDRDYIGVHWNRKYIRAVQAILNATKGKVGRGVSFFEKAFGKNEDEFMELLIMPETFLLFRFFFEHLGYTQQWREAMATLTETEKEELYPIIFKNDFNHIDDLTPNVKFRKILSFYKNYRGDIADPKSELYRLKKEFDKSQA